MSDVLTVLEPARDGAKPRPLWERALERRELEHYERMQAIGRLGGRPRIHPRAMLGDKFGDWEVIGLLRQHPWRGQRVRIRCSGGHQRDVMVYQARASANRQCARCYWRCLRLAADRKEAIQAASGSTRAIAKALGVSQTTVSKLRRLSTGQPSGSRVRGKP